MSTYTFQDIPICKAEECASFISAAHLTLAHQPHLGLRHASQVLFVASSNDYFQLAVMI